MKYDEEEYDKFVERLNEQFPGMYTENRGGIGVGMGWWPIIEKLSTIIKTHTEMRNNASKMHGIIAVEPVKVTQVKEKFGGLRFYYTGGDQYVDGAVTMAESMSTKTCEVCGKPGYPRTKGWIKTLCDEHAK